MTTKDIKTAILNGQQFSNEVANWFTVFKPSINVYSICINEQYYSYKNIDSAARRVNKLINYGH